MIFHSKYRQISKNNLMKILLMFAKTWLKNPQTKSVFAKE